MDRELSVSLMMRNRAVLRSPRVSSSSSSYRVISRSSAMSKGASLAPQEMRMDFAVLPALNLKSLYCRTAKWLGLFCSSASNIWSTDTDR